MEMVLATINDLANNMGVLSAFCELLMSDGRH